MLQAGKCRDGNKTFQMTHITFCIESSKKGVPARWSFRHVGEVVLTNKTEVKILVIFWFRRGLRSDLRAPNL